MLVEVPQKEVVDRMGRWVGRLGVVPVDVGVGVSIRFVDPLINDSDCSRVVAVNIDVEESESTKIAPELYAGSIW